jgi:imidazolonepropionase-like amidohydrolase
MMARTRFRVAALMVASGLQGSGVLAGQSTTAFVNVSLVTMEEADAIPGQTVLVHGDRIAEIGAAGVLEVPRDALRIDGSGRYLMPGLADMHVHVSLPQHLIPHLTHGVTTLRLAWGGPHQLYWREKIERGEMLGPRIYAAGPTVFGTHDDALFGPAPEKMPDYLFPVADAADAVRAVRLQSEAGYDFIKVYSYLSADAYAAALATASQAGMPVAGHVPGSVGVEHAVRAGQASIEHITWYTELTDTYRAREPPVTTRRLKKLQWLLSVGEEVASGSVAMADVVDEGRFDAGFEDNPEWGEAGEIWAQLNREHVLRLHEAGVRLLAGTDRPTFTVLAELETLQKAGLSPFEALATATRSPAEFLGEIYEWGTIAVGSRADLLLLEANPLEDVTNIRQQTGVMVRGDWYDAADLESIGRVATLLLEASDLAAAGNSVAALASVAEAEAVPSRWVVPLHVWSALCWDLAEAGAAAEALPLCDRGAEADPDWGWFRSTRAFARAHAGDREGAADDAEAFLTWSEGPIARSWPVMDASRAVWRERLDALRAGPACRCEPL